MLYKFELETCIMCEVRNEVGFVTGENYLKAIEKITDSFHDDELISVKLTYVTDSELIFIPKEVSIDAIYEENEA